MPSIFAPRRSMPKHSDGERRPFSAQPDALLTLAAAGLLAAGALIQGAAATGHEVGIESLGDHADVSLALPHILLVGAIICGAWTALRAVWRSLRRRQVSWHIPFLAAIVGICSYGHFVEAGIIALALSVAMNLMNRHEYSSDRS